jgi:hypothetical protein
MPMRSKLRTVLAQKDQLLEICPVVRLGKPIICEGLSVPCDKPRPSTHAPVAKPCDFRGSCSGDGVRTNLLFTMSNRTGGRLGACRKPLFLRMNLFQPCRGVRLRAHALRRDSLRSWPAKPKLAQQAKAGGAGRDRTDDPLLAKQVLSQLSYGPLIGDVSASALRAPA